MTDSVVTASKKILLVEDEKYIRELYAHILRREGYDVEEAEDGQVGYDKIRVSDHDLILLDIMLPHIDGMQILSELHNASLIEKIQKIVLLTNLDQDQLIAQSVSYGVRGYLVKSQNPPEKLARQISEYII